ncbi:MAG: hypothetical protein QM765_05960 [Myxococcales bacterium]
MRWNLRALIVALSCALVPGGAWAADAKKNAPAAAPKAGETAVADQKVKGFQKKKKEEKKEEKKKPASFTADIGEEVEIGAQADQKRDEQIEQLKKIIPKVQGPQEGRPALPARRAVVEQEQVRGPQGHRQVRRGARQVDGEDQQGRAGRP